MNVSGSAGSAGFSATRTVASEPSTNSSISAAPRSRMVARACSRSAPAVVTREWGVSPTLP